MVIANIRFYSVDPSAIFSTTINGTAVYEGPAIAAGTATITDLETGIQGETLDDDSAGGETSTADATLGGLTSTGSDVDAEIVWTLRDSVTLQEFQVVRFQIEDGPLTGNYTLSEVPLVPGRTYETIEYDTNPDVTAGDPVFTYSDFSEFGSDGIVTGTSGDDVIDTSYTGDNDGDKIDNFDNIFGRVTNDEVFRWTDYGVNGADISAGITDTIGGIDITVGYMDDGGGDSFEVTTANQYVGPGPFDENSAGELVGDGPAGSTSTVTFDFAAASGGGKENYVRDLLFRLNEIDSLPGSWIDIVTITAFGPDGVEVPVTLVPAGSDTVVGQTVTAASGNNEADDAESSVLVSVPGHVSQLIIDYDNGADFGQFMTISDLHFSSVDEYGDQDDIVDAGAGDDFIDPNLGNDTVDGGTGNDTIVAGIGNDSLLGGDDQDTIQLDDGFGTDTVLGGEGGVDTDVLDASALTSSVDVTVTGDEAGTLTDGASTAEFSEIEDFILTAQDDTFDASAAVAPVDVQAGAGNDTLTGGIGHDSISGDDGDDIITDDGPVFDASLIGTDIISNGDFSSGSTDWTITNGGTFGGGRWDGTGLAVGGSTDGVDASATQTLTTIPGAVYTLAFDYNAYLNGTAEPGEFQVLIGGQVVEVIVDTTDDGTIASTASITFTAETASTDLTFFFDASQNVSGRDIDIDNVSVVVDSVPLSADTLSGGAGNDTIAGGQGNDLLSGGADADIFLMEDGFDTDTIAGGEGGTDNDTLDGTALTSGVDVILSGDEQGTFSDGTDTAGFTEIETFDLTDQDDSFDGTASDASATVNGGTGDDTITGTSAADLIDAGDDADLIGLADSFGADTIIGGEGGTDSDTLTGAALTAGVDVVITSNETGTITDGVDTAGFSEIENFILTDQDDTFDGALSTDPLNVEAGDGADSLIGGTGDDSLLGQGGDDTFGGGAGDDQLDGGDDADTFLMEDGFDSDTITGGEGGNDSDTVNAAALSAAADVVLTSGEAGTITDGVDTAGFSEVEQFVLTGQDDTFDGQLSDASATVEGGAGDDTIIGTTAADSLTGGDDADEFGLVDGFGADTITGGEGGTDNDTLTAAALSAAADVVLTSGEAGTITDGVDTAGFTEVEQFVLTGQDDTFDGQLSDASATVDGGAGDDTIIGTTAADSLTGGNDADTFGLVDGFGSDTITGGEGGTDQDVVDASDLTAGVDLSLSGDETGTIDDGTDTAIFSQIEEFILTDQADIFDGQLSSIAATVQGGAGDDTFTGTSAADLLLGGDDQDTFQLIDGYGNDTIAGGEGGTDTDTLNASALSVSVAVTFNASEAGSLNSGSGALAFTEIESFVLTSFNDTFDGSLGDFPISVSAGDGDDAVTGGAGDDTLTGGTGADTLAGGDGNDVLSGGDGDDVISVGVGDDASGGDGDDTFLIVGDDGTAPIFITGGEGNEGGGDTLNFNGFLDNGTLNITQEDSVAGGISGTALLTDGTLVTFTNIENIICFAAGTMILTEAGEIPVEDLVEGDLVMTVDHGFQPLKWVGAREVPAQGKLAPIVIEAGVLGNTTRLMVSPQHRMLIEGPRAELLFGVSECLVAASHLLHWDGVYRAAGGHVSYHHILFEDHQIVFANGAKSESFHPGRQALQALDTDAREEVLSLFPELRHDDQATGSLARHALKAFEAAAL